MPPNSNLSLSDRTEVRPNDTQNSHEVIANAVPIAEMRWRERARVAGRVRSMRIQPWGGVPTLECTLVDATGGVAVVFLGRREVAGIHPGTCLAIEGMVGEHNGRLAILNPTYDFVTSQAGSPDRPVS